jgi:hypothetical protein
MSNVLSNQQRSANLSSSRQRMRSVTLWTIQGVSISKCEMCTRRR